MGGVVSGCGRDEDVELADGGLHDPEGLECGGERVAGFFLARLADLAEETSEGLDTQ